MDYLERPTKTKVKKFKAKIAAINTKAEAKRKIVEEALEAEWNEAI